MEDKLYRLLVRDRARTPPIDEHGRRVYEECLVQEQPLPDSLCSFGDKKPSHLTPSKRAYER